MTAATQLTHRAYLRRHGLEIACIDRRKLPDFHFERIRFALEVRPVLPNLDLCFARMLIAARREPSRDLRCEGPHGFGILSDGVKIPVRFDALSDGLHRLAEALHSVHALLHDAGGAFMG